jgi:hypothetical protein
VTHAGYADSDPLPIAGVQHLAFCEPLWALIQLESIQSGIHLSAEGNALRKRAHSGDLESRPGALIRSTLPFHSLRLGLTGESDILRTSSYQPAVSGVAGFRGLWTAFQIECKLSRGKSTKLRTMLLGEFDDATDSRRFYFLGDQCRGRVEHHGNKGRRRSGGIA